LYVILRIILVKCTEEDGIDLYTCQVSYTVDDSDLESTGPAGRHSLGPVL